MSVLYDSSQPKRQLQNLSLPNLPTQIVYFWLTYGCEKLIWNCLKITPEFYQTNQESVYFFFLNTGSNDFDKICTTNRPQSLLQFDLQPIPENSCDLNMLLFFYA